MVYIDAVHYEEDRGSDEGIIRVKYTNTLNEEATNDVHIQAVIDFINKTPNQVKTKYLKKYRETDNSIVSKWIEGAYVEVIDGRYLRSKSNKSSVDNLENLPEY